MKKFIIHPFILILTSICLNSYSQIGITDYSLYVLGVNTSQNRRISAELKTFLNYEFDYLQMEIDAYFNFKPRDYHRFSIGLGVNGHPFIGYDHVYALTIPVQLEVYPFQGFKRLSLLYELSTMYIVEDNIRLRNLLGIRYSFGKKLKEE